MKRRVLCYLLLFTISSVKGQQWSDVGGGVSGGIGIEILKADTANNLLYAGGTFTHAGGNSASMVASWNGTSWSSLGNQAFHGGGVIAITFFNGDLIVGGDIDSIGNTRVDNIARWDGFTWQPMGAGLQHGGVYALAVYNGVLYAGGAFDSSGAKRIRYFGKWDGLGWNTVKYGMEAYVTEMISFEGKLFISGAFSEVRINDTTTTPCNTMVGWNDTDWVSVDGGTSQDVATRFEVVDDTLFYTSHTTIRYWNGNTWQAIAFPIGGAQGWALDIAKYNSGLYVCGYFDDPPDLGMYNGIGYDTVTYDVAGYFNNLENYNGDLYVAGAFSSIDGAPFNSIAKYNPANGINSLYADATFSIYPNPCVLQNNEFLKINSLFKLDYTRIELRTIDGCKVYSENKKQFTSTQIPTNNIKPGVYLLEIYLSDNNYKETFKVIII